jgi:hypothetical protein
VRSRSCRGAKSSHRADTRCPRYPRALARSTVSSPSPFYPRKARDHAHAHDLGFWRVSGPKMRRASRSALSRTNCEVSRDERRERRRPGRTLAVRLAWDLRWAVAGFNGPAPAAQSGAISPCRTSFAKLSLSMAFSRAVSAVMRPSRQYRSSAMSIVCIPCA